MEPLEIAAVAPAPNGQPMPMMDRGARPASTTYVWVVSACTASFAVLLCTMLLCP